ncbi:alpha-galactosidase [Ginsengibacter hankyongi]|uniref:alpha-galactosidase n=1 Tax=Ginsengibacter hankyongi TaxID=2607284 RepID=UPI001925F6E7|nr:alpha-galactosidase [Ginsengibacter hankyongi]
MKSICFILLLCGAGNIVAQNLVQQKLEQLPVYHPDEFKSAGGDWLLGSTKAVTHIFKSTNGNDLTITNGLVSRKFRLQPYMACYEFKNLMTGKEMLRAIEPEAEIEINGKSYNVGGAVGQFERGYMQYDWLNKFSNDVHAFQLVDFSIRDIQSRFEWNPGRWATNKQWPPQGKQIDFTFRLLGNDLQGVTLDVIYEMYDNIPLMSKSMIVHNEGNRIIRINTFKSEKLAMVEESSGVNTEGVFPSPHICIQSDYTFGGNSFADANHTTYWLTDSLYSSQVNYNLQSHCLVESKPPIGPEYVLQPGKNFETFHTYELMYDGYDKERCGLAERKMYRILAPWITENPIFLHLTTTDPGKVKAAINQCAEVGFEMVILSFGSGLDMEDTSNINIEKFKALADYAHLKGIEIGGYSLFSSRSIDSVNDVINPKTGKPGGAIFGDAPCLGSKWGLEYLQKLKTFITKTGFNVLENDGPYPGDICASTTHPGHDGLKDSQWKQWYLESSFYQWLRKKDVYLNAPDWYFLNGSNKTGVGYREDNWSLPRERQIILGRQNIYDGTWDKAPGMSWTFVPLTQYHGGGDAATIEPLHNHLDAYQAHLAQNFGSGIQACYRGPRLFDAPATEALVKKEVAWYKKYRNILNADIIHIRRPDGRDYDAIMHVDAKGKEKALVMIYNPLDIKINRKIKLPLYYTGLTTIARIREKENAIQLYHLNRDYSVEVSVGIAAHSYTWLVIE